MRFGLAVAMARTMADVVRNRVALRPPVGQSEWLDGTFETDDRLADTLEHLNQERRQARLSDRSSNGRPQTESLRRPWLKIA
jgi:hypothetical protein